MDNFGNLDFNKAKQPKFILQYAAITLLVS